MRKVWGSLLELARFVWETREAFRRPGEAPGGRALKTREDRKKREFFGGARRKAREPQEPQEALWQTEITGGGLGVARGWARETSQKCVVTLFEARGPKEPQEALRGAAALALEVRFQEQAILELVRAARLPIWWSGRPLSMAWMVVEQNGQRSLLRDGGPLELGQALQRQARKAKGFSRLAEVDEDGSGEINFAEFVQFMHSHGRASGGRQEL